MGMYEAMKTGVAPEIEIAAGDVSAQTASQIIDEEDADSDEEDADSDEDGLEDEDESDGLDEEESEGDAEALAQTSQTSSLELADKGRFVLVKSAKAVSSTELQANVIKRILGFLLCLVFWIAHLVYVVSYTIFIFPICFLWT